MAAALAPEIDAYLRGEADGKAYADAIAAVIQDGMTRTQEQGGGPVIASAAA